MARFTSEEQGPSLSQEQETSHDRFLAVMQESTDVFWVLTPKGEMQEIGSNWHAFTGQEEYTSSGQGWLDALHPADQPLVEDALLQVVTSRRSVEMECHLRRWDGIYRLIRLHALPVRDPSGVLHEIVICGNDLTRQEQNGQMSEAQAQLVMNISGMGIWDWNCLTNQFM